MQDREEKLGRKDLRAQLFRTRHTRKTAPIRLSFVLHNSLEANGKSAPNCKYLSKHPHRLVNGYDTHLQIGNAQPSQLGPNSRNC